MDGRSLSVSKSNHLERFNDYRRHGLAKDMVIIDRGPWLSSRKSVPSQETSQAWDPWISRIPFPSRHSIYPPFPPSSSSPPNHSRSSRATKARQIFSPSDLWPISLYFATSHTFHLERAELSTTFRPDDFNLSTIIIMHRNTFLAALFLASPSLTSPVIEGRGAFDPLFPPGPQYIGRFSPSL